MQARLLVHVHSQIITQRRQARKEKNKTLRLCVRQYFSNVVISRYREPDNKFCPLSVRSFNCYGAAMFPDNLMANIRRTITLGTHVRTEGALSSFVALFVQWPVASFIKHFMRMVKGSPGDFYSA